MAGRAKTDPPATAWPGGAKSVLRRLAHPDGTRDRSGGRRGRHGCKSRALLSNAAGREPCERRLGDRSHAQVFSGDRLGAQGKIRAFFCQRAGQRMPSREQGANPGRVTLTGGRRHPGAPGGVCGPSRLRCGLPGLHVPRPCAPDDALAFPRARWLAGCAGLAVTAPRHRRDRHPLFGGLAGGTVQARRDTPCGSNVPSLCPHRPHPARPGLGSRALGALGGGRSRPVRRGGGSGGNVIEIGGQTAGVRGRRRLVAPGRRLTGR